jgi:hypothetical protein
MGKRVDRERVPTL